MQAQQAENARVAGTKGLAGPGEHRPHVRGAITGCQGVESLAGAAQFADQGSEGPLRAEDGAGGDDVKCERQAGAPLGQLTGGLLLAGDTFVAETVAQQFAGLA